MDSTTLKKGYAEVCVNSPAARQQTFSYSIPPNLKVEVGQAVWVPFGARLLQGIVIELTERPAVEQTREIAGNIEPTLVLSTAHIKLARWISKYYLSPLFDAVSLMLPPGFERSPITFVSLSDTSSRQDLFSLTLPQRETVEIIRGKGKIRFSELEKALGKKKAQAVVSQLVNHGLVVRSYEMEPLKVKPKEEVYLSLVNPDEARALLANQQDKRAKRQTAVLEFLAFQSEPVPWKEVRQKLKICQPVVDALLNKGLVKLERIEVKREPISYTEIELSYPLNLTAAQRAALDNIKPRLISQNGNSPYVFLLHGVTASGKTEIYLQALAEAVKLGKRGIVLVPEIALTPQTIERFASRFPHKVAVLHSGLSLGEQFDEWRRIKDGEFDVVIGPRSAIFAPQPNLGLIVIDEEHEWTYKQTEKSPRYHTRNVALKLAELTGSVVVLGSATPAVETYYHAERGDYQLLPLPERVTPEEASPLPEVEVVDLRDELKTGNRSIFSRSLAKGTFEAMNRGGQVMLFLNRRGAASFVQCRNCGFVMRCKRCEVALTYHMAEDALVCHHCNNRTAIPRICPKCRSTRIKFLGIGTQKLEMEAGLAFPQARLLRWDSDVTRGKKGSHGEILNKFRVHKADILIGTQMIAKGLDLPLVTLVGVVNADISLNLPDFRAGERTFQLLAQVAGRAGRGVMGGRVIVQTYSPEHYAVQAAAKHDYKTFYEQEIKFRRQLQNPPFAELAVLMFAHSNDDACRKEAERLKQHLTLERDSRGLADISFVGPAPAFIHKLRGRFRWQLTLRGSNLSEFLGSISLPRWWTVDIDPAGLT